MNDKNYVDKNITNLLINDFKELNGNKINLNKIDNPVNGNKKITSPSIGESKIKYNENDYTSNDTVKTSCKINQIKNNNRKNYFENREIVTVSVDPNLKITKF